MQLNDVRERLKAMGRSQADLARHLNLDPSSLVKTLDGRRTLRQRELIKLETFFGEKLVADTSAAPAEISSRSRRSRRVPVYGYAAAGGEDRIAFADDQVLEWLDPPPWWNGEADLVYVRITGDSMEPRIHSGEVIPVRLRYPPAKGDDCLVEFRDNTALCKTYESQKNGRVYLKQYNEAKTVDVDASTVRALHTVWRPGLI